MQTHFPIPTNRSKALSITKLALDHAKRGLNLGSHLRFRVFDLAFQTTDQILIGVLFIEARTRRNRSDYLAILMLRTLFDSRVYCRFIELYFPRQIVVVEPVLLQMNAQYGHRRIRRTAPFAVWIIWLDRSNQALQGHGLSLWSIFGWLLYSQGQVLFVGGQLLERLLF